MTAARAGGWLAAAAVGLAAAGALAAAFPAVLRIPPRDPNGRASPAPALFSHRSHGLFGCYACHPALFPQALVGFTHAEMRQGQFCGGCHEGRTAFAIQGAACGRCHVDGR